MSRWTTTFEQHAFRAQWARLIAANESIKAEDPEILPHIEELSRLRKVIAYIDSAIAGVDPELVPLNFWDALRDQMSAGADQLTGFSTSKNISNLHNANQNVDNILNQLRPYALGKGRLGPALQSAAKAYSETLTEAANSLREQAAQVLRSLTEAQQNSSVIAGKAKSEAEELQLKYADLLVSSEGREAALDVLARHIDEINSFYRRLVVGGDGSSPSIKEEIAVAREAATSGKDAIDKLDAVAASTVKELTTFETRVLGSLDQDGKRSGGLSDELNSRLRVLADVEEQQKKRYAALNEKIESLIPGATSAGLATAYKQMKDSFAKPIRRANQVFYWSIAAIVLLSFIVSIDGVGLWWIKFSQMTDWSSVGRALAHKLPFYAPLVWLAYFASKRRSEFQRLEQEYAHKESLAKSYDSYRKQIEELGEGSDQLMRDLLAKAVDAIAFNASVSLDGRHGDKIPLQEALEKLIEKAAVLAARQAASAGPLS